MSRTRAEDARRRRVAGVVRDARHRLRDSLLGLLLDSVNVVLGEPGVGAPAFGLVEVQSQRMLLNPQPARDLTVEQWIYVIAHLGLHLGFEHRPVRLHDEGLLWARASELVIDGFLHQLRLGEPPPGYLPDPTHAGQREEAIVAQLRGRPPGALPPLATLAGSGRLDLQPGDPGPASGAPRPDHPRLLAAGLRRAVAGAVDQAAETRLTVAAFTPAEQARRWVMQQLPILGALAAELRIVFDRSIVKRFHIQVAAVDARLGEIYLNPDAPLSAEEWLFVVTHEVLHVALGHRARRRGRDPFVWNLACDFVINGWLIEMGVGTMPSIGGLHDEALAGQSAEALYDQLIGDLRRSCRLRGLRGDEGDLLDHDDQGPPCDWDDARLRRCLAAGLACPGRGLEPAGLIEEIRSLFTPPVPWEVELAQWADQHVPWPLEPRRSYARASRRQGSTPDIVRPGRLVPEAWRQACTFGVVLDTSGSMDRGLLGRALGAVASYAEARGVPAVRVVCCDAAPHDLGPLSPAELRGTVPIRGRGGTVLQTAVALFNRLSDFPSTAPLMILTDGQGEETLRVSRPHCFLLPRPWAHVGSGGHRPSVLLRTTAPVFRVLREG